VLFVLQDAIDLRTRSGRSLAAGPFGSPQVVLGDLAVLLIRSSVSSRAAARCGRHAAVLRPLMGDLGQLPTALLVEGRELQADHVPSFDGVRPRSRP